LHLQREPPLKAADPPPNEEGGPSLAKERSAAGYDPIAPRIRSQSASSRPTIAEALELTALVARKQPDRYGRFAARWLCLYLEEHEKATLDVM
jgi:hypothetical protein